MSGNEEHKARTREMIKVMQAYVDGKEIEWAVGEPEWNWEVYQYRIATTPDSIDWSHVAPEWKYMARDIGGDAWLYQSEPQRMLNSWTNGISATRTRGFASYKRGTADWKDSLVMRPET